MQTRFSDDARRDPTLQQAEDILRKCVHCGFCLATCPTYVLDGDERDSPRGRIYLMKAFLETGAGADETLRHLDRCLSCGSCETTCPSGVDYLTLAAITRPRVEKAGRRPVAQDAKRRLFLWLLPHDRAFAAALALGRLARPFEAVLPRFARKLLKQLPTKKGTPWQVLPVEGKAAPRVILHEGCVQKHLAPQINEATARVLAHFGYEVLRLPMRQCCGAMADHMGAAEKARAEAAHLLSCVARIEEEGPVAAFISNASGCGVELKDYARLMAGTKEEASAHALAAKTFDIGEFLSGLDLGPVREPRGERLAWSPPCTLQHGQKRAGDIPGILTHFGYEIVLPREAHLCCGAAGTYAFLEVDRAEKLRSRKLSALADCGARRIVSANIGCITGLSSEATIPVVHWVEVLAEALAEGRAQI